MFNELPGAYLNWDQTEESLDDWLRYSVYRRLPGETEGTRIQVISDPSLTTFTDSTIMPGEAWEYAVSQTILSGADEVESELTDWATVTVNVESAFVHDYANPEYYVEIQPESLAHAVQQDIAYVQVWGRPRPTAHIGPGEQQNVEIRVTDDWESASEVWTAMRELLTRQRENGSVFVVRHPHDVRFFCQIEAPNRSDQGVLYTKSVTLREVFVDEEV